MRFLEGKGRVDREAGIIYGVRLCGPHSGNGRYYPPQTFLEALHLVSGLKVKIDHPAKRPDETRSSTSTFGWVEAPRVGDDGALYGDLHYLRDHEMADLICEAAERNPRLYGLSANWTGEIDGTDSDGLQVVRRILDAISFDIVDQPATSESLFESLFEGQVMPTIRHIIHANYRIRPRMKVRLKEASDANDWAAATPMMEPQTGGGTVDWRARLADAVGACVAASDPDAHEAALAIMKLLKPQEPEGPGEAEPEEEEKVPPGRGPDDDLAGDDDADAPRKRTQESRRPRLAHDGRSLVEAISDERPRPARGRRRLSDDIARRPATDAKSFLDAIIEGW
jgi:hypothetical protein